MLITLNISHSRSLGAELESLRQADQEKIDSMQLEFSRKITDLRSELEKAEERENDVKRTLKEDYEFRLGRESTKWEGQVKRLEEEKDMMASKLEDYTKIRSQSERMREKVEEQDGINKVLKTRLAAVEESNAKVTMLYLLQVILQNYFKPQNHKAS